MANGKSGEADHKETITKLEYFTLFRRYRICEHDLLNQRLNWNLTIQGFLLALYGYSLQKLAELEKASQLDGHPVMSSNYGYVHLQYLLKLIIPIMGCVMSVSVLAAVLGAFLALQELHKQWGDKVEHKFGQDPFLPNPSGAGLWYASKLGFVPLFAIPIAFIIVWVWIYFVGPTVFS